MDETTSYAAARQEVLLRMKLRDQILLTYLVVVATLLGIALKTPDAYSILLVIPFLALATISLITAHMVVADHLGEFCYRELGKCFANIPQWDNSKSFHSYTMTSSKLRTVAHALIVLVPSIMALGINYSHAFGSPFPYGPIWWFCLLCFLGVVAIMYIGYQARKEKYTKRDWEKENAKLQHPGSFGSSGDTIRNCCKERSI
ncbi:MAG: hypothetical protein MI862_14970 [Desulfobacterales bacterium]|nr:hypothetical protein [Desulfobacterales bacterium]